MNKFSFGTVHLSKALYGTLRAALLFYKRLRNNLEDMGFEFNPCDPCMTKKMVNGKKITICWHMDDLKVSRMEKPVVSALALTLAKLYGPKTTISHGKVYNYLGMEIEFGTDPGVIIVSVVNDKVPAEDHRELS